MPAISIIMNVRDGEATLRAALDSAVAQTFSDWELIVWDDRSSDDSAAMVAEFTDPRIHYCLAPQQTALGRARDAAIRRAQGEWLAFLDQDDVWLPRKLELQLALVDSRDVGLIYGRTLCFDVAGSDHDYDGFHEFEPLPEGNITAELLGKGCFIAMSSALLRRAAVDENGGIPARIHITPDYFLYLAVCSKYSARAVQDVVCRYRVHAGSMTSVYRRESLEETLQLVEDWRGHLSPEAFARRRAHISTALALVELRHGNLFFEGSRRLLKDGSLAWLAGRPFVHLWRIVRRKLRTPYWMKSK
jgi:glycosyltransferase involved in cell wall biosynthesis